MILHEQPEGCLQGSAGKPRGEDFRLLPLFVQFMPLDQLIASFGVFILLIQTKWDIVIFNTSPFDFFKGSVITVVTMMVYRCLRPILKGSIERGGKS